MMKTVYQRKIVCLLMAAGIVSALLCGRVVAQQTGRVGAISANRAPNVSNEPAKTPNTEDESKNATNTTNATTDVATNKNSQAVQEAMKAYQSGDVDQAKTILAEVQRNDPDFPPSEIVLAQFASSTQQSQQIRQWLEQAAWEHPEDPQAYFMLANFALMESRLTEARLLTETGIAALDNLPKDGKRRKAIASIAESVQARLYLMRDDWDASRRHFENLATLEPDNFSVLERLGFVAAHQGKYDEAVAFFAKANEKGGKFPSPKLMVSQIADQLGKADIAKKYFDQAVAAADLDAESLRIALQIQLRQGNIDEAAKLLAKADKVDPGNIDNRIFAGMIALFKKDYPAAEKLFQDAVLISPNNYVALHGLALALAEQGGSLRMERALAYAKNNVQNSGESSDSVATLAWVYFKADKMIEAEYLGNLVLSSGEVSPLNAYFLAEIVAASGNKDKALSLARLATSSNDNFIKKSEALALLKKLESEAEAPAPLQATETQTQSPPESQPAPDNRPKTPVRIPTQR